MLMGKALEKNELVRKNSYCLLNKKTLGKRFIDFIEFHNHIYSRLEWS